MASSLVCCFAVLLLLVISQPPSAGTQAQEGGTQTYPWAFPGAYSYYLGSSAFPGGVSVKMTYLLNVLAVNSSKAQVLTEMNFTAPGIQPSDNRLVEWISIVKSATLPVFIATDKTALYNYETTVTVSGKEVPVVANVYDRSTSGGPIVVSFVDENLGLPVQYTYSYQGLSITSSLVSTNVPGLIP